MLSFSGSVPISLLCPAELNNDFGTHPNCMKRRLHPQKREQTAIHKPAAGRPEQEAQPDAVYIRGNCRVQTVFQNNAMRDEAENGEGETGDEGADGVYCFIHSLHVVPCVQQRSSSYSEGKVEK